MNNNYYQSLAISFYKQEMLQVKQAHNMCPTYYLYSGMYFTCNQQTTTSNYTAVQIFKKPSNNFVYTP